MSRKRIAAVEDLSNGEAIKFEFQRDGKTVEGFLARFEGRFVAYENVCQHIAISLDYGDGRFFNQNRSHFVCQTHGATYEPLTGLCVRGPCEGDSLKKLNIEIRNGAVWLKE